MELKDYDYNIEATPNIDELPEDQSNFRGGVRRIYNTPIPSSASDSGDIWEIRFDSSYIYICTATNTWKRTAISTW